MTLTTPVKAASGLALTSAGVAGSALAYKYATGLYAIEKLSLDEQAIWKVKAEENSVVVFAKASENNLASKYGVENDGIWTCNLKISDSSKFDDFKNKLKTYFGTTEINTETTTSIISEHKISLLNSCSSNRNSKESSKDKVISEIKVDYTKVDEELKTIFGGFLNQVETKISPKLSDLTFSAGNFALEPTTSPQKVKVTITAANAASKSVLGDETWTCTIEGFPSTGTNLATDKDTGDLNTTLSGKLTSESDKWGLVNSCARNRTSDFGDKKVTSILKLNVSKSEDNKLKFNENQLNKVFKGDWINPKE